MANSEHVQILEQGVEEWNLWRDQHSDSTPSLSRVSLPRADLREANLGEADLTAANLRGADLTAVNLAEADLTAANLTGANLTGADLTGANQQSPRSLRRNSHQG